MAVLSEGVVVAATALYAGFYRQEADTGLWPGGWGGKTSSKGQTSGSSQVIPRIKSHLGKPLKRKVPQRNSVVPRGALISKPCTEGLCKAHAIWVNR